MSASLLVQRLIGPRVHVVCKGVDGASTCMYCMYVLENKIKNLIIILVRHTVVIKTANGGTEPHHDSEALSRQPLLGHTPIIIFFILYIIYIYSILSSNTLAIWLGIHLTHRFTLLVACFAPREAFSEAFYKAFTV